MTRAARTHRPRLPTASKARGRYRRCGNRMFKWLELGSAYGTSRFNPVREVELCSTARAIYLYLVRAVPFSVPQYEHRK